MSEDCETSPLATAAKSLKDDGEMFRVMGELTEIPWLFNFERLRTLLCWEYNPQWVKEEFKKLLSTMPVDKVTSKNTVSLNSNKVNNSCVRVSGTLLQIATFEHGKEDFAKMLLDFGLV